MTNEELAYIKEYKRWPTPINDSLILNKYYYILAILLLFIGWEYISYSNELNLLKHSAIFLFFLIALIYNVVNYNSENQFESILINDSRITFIIKVVNNLNWELVLHKDSYVSARVTLNFLTSPHEITIVLLDHEILMNSKARSAKQRNQYNREKLFNQFKMALERELKNNRLLLFS